MSSEAEAETHEGKIAIGDIRTVDGAAEPGIPKVQYVHYSGSQQLILWLPRPGYQGYGELVVARDGVEIERARVTDRLNGSVQILWDTLGWPPGAYAITISHDEGWRHEVSLTKFAPGVEPPQEPVIVVEDLHPPARDAAGEIIYRDGFGNVIEDEAAAIRQQASRDLAARFGRRLEYTGSFRDGVIIYFDGRYRIEFPHQMCGGALKFIIDVPIAERWEKATDAPLSIRDDIIAFVAETVQREQASSWRYEITSRSIDFY